MDFSLTISGLAPPSPELRLSSEAAFGRSGHRHIAFPLMVYVLDSTNTGRSLKRRLTVPQNNCNRAVTLDYMHRYSVIDLTEAPG